MGKVTIPHRLSAEPPLHKGAFTLHTTNMRLSGAGRCKHRPLQNGGREHLAPEGSMWEEHKAPLRKCSHSCIFRRFVLLPSSLGFLGASAWRRTTSAASLLRKPARAVIRPAGANIARSPVSLRSTVVPCSQPRNPLGRGSLPRNSETFFASFFGHKKGRPNGRIPLKTSAPPQGGGKRQLQNKSIHRPSGSKQPLHFIRQLPMLRHHQVRVNGQKRLGFFLGHFQRAGVLHQICHP